MNFATEAGHFLDRPVLGLNNRIGNISVRIADTIISQEGAISTPQVYFINSKA